MKTNLIRLAAAAVLFGASGAVLAFPCYQGFVDGHVDTPVAEDATTYRDTCVDGPDGDTNDSASDLTGFFGETTWIQIDKFNTNDKSATGGDGTSGVLTVDTLVTSGDGPYQFLEGHWFVSEEVWDSYSAIAIVLKDGGKCKTEGGCPKPKKDDPPPPPGEYEVYWSAYSVTTGHTSGDWSMPSFNLSHFTVYGVECENGNCGGDPPAETPIPAPIALLGLGSLLLAWRSRKSSS